MRLVSGPCSETQPTSASSGNGRSKDAGGLIGAGEDTLSVAPPFPRAAVESPRPTTTACSLRHIALDVSKTARLSFDHGRHPDHPQAQRPPDRRGPGQDRDPGRTGAGGTSPEGWPTGG